MGKLQESVLIWWRGPRLGDKIYGKLKKQKRKKDNEWRSKRYIIGRRKGRCLGKFLQEYLAWETGRSEQSSWLLVGLLAPHIFFTKNIIYTGGGDRPVSNSIFLFVQPRPPPPHQDQLNENWLRLSCPCSWNFDNEYSINGLFQNSRGCKKFKQGEKTTCWKSTYNLLYSIHFLT